MEMGAAGPSPGRLVWRQLRRNPLAIASLIVLAIIVLMAIFYPLVSHYRYDHQTNDYSAPASARHWLGTDDSGYDTLTRLAVGARISLVVGVGVEAIVLLVGGLVGLVAGFYGKWLDAALMRLTDMMFAFPDILLAILIMAIKGPSLLNIFIALGITGWPGMAPADTRSGAVFARAGVCGSGAGFGGSEQPDHPAATFCQTYCRRLSWRLPLTLRA